MTDVKELVKLAVDGHRGSVEKYSVKQSQDALREALIELNGGSTVLDYRAIRDGKCNGLFTLVEELLEATVSEGLAANDFFTNFVDYRNVAEGDEAEFDVEDSTLFFVDEIADGTQGIRRQRLGELTKVTIPTTMKAVKIYEELNRILAGRVDFNHMIDKVAESFQQKILNDVFTLYSGLTSDQLGGVAYFPTLANDYDEEDVLDVIAHVEAAAGGKTATIVGTKKALRKLIPSIQGDGYKDDNYNMGYAGKFYGSPVLALPQRHKVGTTAFAFPDDVITIVAGDEKPIKVVRRGEPLVIMGDPMLNADLTQTYFYGEAYGVGLVAAANSGIGRYEIPN